MICVVATSCRPSGEVANPTNDCGGPSNVVIDARSVPGSYAAIWFVPRLPL